MVDTGQNGRPETAVVLEAWRKKKGFSKQGLAERSGVSGTYVRMIEDGREPHTGKMVTPSAKVILQLARALGAGDAREERQAYEELMAAAGYVEPGSATQYDSGYRSLAGEIDQNGAGGPTRQARDGGHQVRETAAQIGPVVERVRPDRSADVLVALRDPRLHGPCRDLLEHWEQLTRQEQDLLLALMEFIAGAPSSGR